MLFQPISHSNRRPIKDQADLKLTSTHGTMHISEGAMRDCGFKVGDAVLIASLPTAAGLTATRTGLDESFFMLKGLTAIVNGEGKTTQRQVGNTVTLTNNKNVISAANIYQQLGGSKEFINNFEINEPVYGLLVNGDVATPITEDSADDAGTVYMYEVNTNDAGVKSLEWVEVPNSNAGFARENGVAFFPLTFVGVEDKQVKAANGTAKAPKAPKAPKAAPVAEVDLDDFEA